MDVANLNAEASMVAWVCTFPNLSKKVEQLSDLSDGIVLFEICEDIDPNWFKLGRSAATDVGESWAFKYNNLKKLFRMLSAYCEEVLQYHVGGMLEPDLNLIAKNNSTPELLRVCSLVITVAVNCEQKNNYIQRIMTLSEEFQGSLMIAIEQTMMQLENFSEDGNGINQSPSNEQLDNSKSGVAYDTTRYGTDMDIDHGSILNSANGEISDTLLRQLNIDKTADEKSINSILQTELLAQLDKNEALQLNLEKLNGEAERWHQKYEEEKHIKNEINNQLEQVLASNSGSVSNPSNTKNDAIIKAENEALRADLDKSEKQSSDMQSQLQETILKLNKANSDLLSHKSLLSELDRLRDQEQEFLFLQERVAKSENIIEKYRIKLEQSSDMKRKLTLAEQNLKRESEAKQAIENKYLNLISSKSDSGSGSSNPSDNLAKLESQLNLATIENANLKNKLVHIETENKKLVATANSAENAARDLEERIRELELTGASLTSKPSNSSSLSTVPNKFELAEAFGESPAQLKKEIEKLNLELKKLRRGSVIQDDHIKEKALLESWVETANKEKLEALTLLANERKLSAEQKLQVELMSSSQNPQIAFLEEQLEQQSAEVADLNNRISSSQSQIKSLFAELSKATRENEEYSAQINNLNSELKEKSILMKELESVKEINLKTTKENHSHELEKENLEGWYADLEMQSKSKSEKIEKLLTEKDEINKMMHEQRNQIAELTLVVDSYKNADTDIDQLKTKLIQSRKEYHESSLALQKSKQVIKTLSSQLESATLGSKTASLPQAQAIQLSEMQEQLDNSHQQIADLKEQNRSIQKQKNFEARLLSSAWFYIQRKLEQNSGFGEASLASMEANYAPSNANFNSSANLGAALNPNLHQSSKRRQFSTSARQFNQAYSGSGSGSGSGAGSAAASTWLESQRSVLDSQIYPRK